MRTEEGRGIWHPAAGGAGRRRGHRASGMRRQRRNRFSAEKDVYTLTDVYASTEKIASTDAFTETSDPANLETLDALDVEMSDFPDGEVSDLTGAELSEPEEEAAPEPVKSVDAGRTIPELSWSAEPERKTKETELQLQLPGKKADRADGGRKKEKDVSGRADRKGKERSVKGGVRTFAAIDVGSFELSMKIYEFGGKNDMKEIDHVSRRLALGSDTYSQGKISPSRLDELCRTLREFGQIMKAYKVESYQAYGTSAIRETTNTGIVLDQIEQRTGIRLGVLSNSEQRFLDYKSIASKGEVFGRILEERTAIVDIGGGSIQLSLFEEDALAATQNLRLGVLRVRERLAHLNARSAQVEGLVDEMASSQLATFKKMYCKDRTYKNIIIVDDYLSPWALKKNGKNSTGAFINVEEYEKIMTVLRTCPPAEVAQKMDIPEERVPLLFISAVILRRAAILLGAENIWAPGATLCDGIAYEYAERNKLLKNERDFEQDILACASNISKRFMGSRKRAETLEKITLTIFDSTKPVHGLGARERLLLRLSALLHDCGKYISMVNLGDASYNIIMSTEIIGLSHKERKMLANIVRYNHSPFMYYGQMGEYGTDLDQNDYLVIAKLTAILRLANSLDRSHKQKFKGVKAQLKENRLVLTVDTQEDITLERSYFEDCCDFFQEVYSVVPVLKQKKKL